jgi:hypothetical protein
MHRHTVTTSALLGWLVLYIQNLKKPYIHETARESYRAWWELRTKDSWHSWGSSFSGRHETSPREQAKILYPHLFPEPEKKRRRRWRSSWRRDWSKAEMVSHTCVLPDGTESTYTWPNIHGPDWRGRRGDFRRGHAKGVKAEKGRRADSFNRERKTLEFRNNAKTPTRWPFSNGAKRSAQIEDNRSDRRRARMECEAVRKAHVRYPQTWMVREGEDYDHPCDWHDPYDRWKWD